MVVVFYQTKLYITVFRRKREVMVWFWAPGRQNILVRNSCINLARKHKKIKSYEINVDRYPEEIAELNITDFNTVCVLRMGKVIWSQISPPIRTIETWMCSCYYGRESSITAEFQKFEKNTFLKTETTNLKSMDDAVCKKPKEISESPKNKFPKTYYKNKPFGIILLGNTPDPRPIRSRHLVKSRPVLENHTGSTLSIFHTYRKSLD